MDRPWLRSAQKLSYTNPEKFLRTLRDFEYTLSVTNTPKAIRNLRTNGLKDAREQRQAALFCYGMSVRIGKSVYFASHEDQDYDFVATWLVEDVRHFSVVQLKEVVPTAINPDANIQSVIAGLGKYKDSHDLTVAVHLNQAARFDPNALRPEILNIASLWVFGSTSPDQSCWSLWGNFTEENPYETPFSYPNQT